MNQVPTNTQITQAIDPKNYTQPVTDLLNGVIVDLPKALLLLVVGVVLIKVISKVLVQVLGLTKLPKALIKVSVRLLDVGLWLLLSIAIFQFIGLSNVAFAMSGAFAVLALGFSQGISQTVNDTIAGLNLARDRHFRIGDKVMAGDQKTIGIIIDMDMRKSRLKVDSGQIHIIPNSLIDKNEFVLIERATAKPEPAKPRRVLHRPSVRTQSSGATIPAKKGQ